MGKLEEKAVNSPGLASSSSAAVRCFNSLAEQWQSTPAGRLSSFQLGQDAFLKEVSVPVYTAGSKFICEVYEIPFSPLSNTVIVGWNSMGCAEPAARQDDLYDFFFLLPWKGLGGQYPCCVCCCWMPSDCMLWLSKVGSLPGFQPVLQV